LEGDPVGVATRTPVKVGFMLTDFTKIAAAFGFSGETDVFQGFKEMVAYLNKHGGLAGRRISPDYWALDGTTTNATTEYQRACTHFTQDVKVEVVISDDNFDPTFEGCMGQAQLLHLNIGIYGLDAAGQREHPIHRGPTTFGVDRYSAALLETVVASGAVKKGQTVGVLVEACAANIRAYDQVWVPQARRLGLKLSMAQSECSNGTGTLGNETSQIQNAVLRFRTESVTSVGFVSPREGFLAVLFSQGAEQQGYRPQYLFTSVALPSRLVLSQGNGLAMPLAQLPGIRGMGWVPITDVGGRAPSQTAAQRGRVALCKKMSPSEAGAANAPDPGVRLDFQGHWLRECDMMLLVRRVAELTDGRFAPPAVFPVYAKAVNAFPSAANLIGDYRATGTRMDGEYAAAPFTYTASCKCIRYTALARVFD
jgi:hypothetical protein